MITVFLKKYNEQYIYWNKKIQMGKSSLENLLLCQSFSSLFLNPFTAEFISRYDFYCFHVDANLR